MERFAFCLDSLYCSEENWDEEEQSKGDCFSRINGDDSDEPIEENPFQVLVCQDLSWEDDEISSLLLKEKRNQESKTLESDFGLDPTRIEAVDWILKVVSHYSFSVLTALLSINYLDRFFSSVHFQREKPWMNQLAAVACLSLAAKIDEVQVPLLLDLQVEDCKYVFEAKTIQRMEILVLSALQWRMHPVTPLSFLGYFTRRLGLKDFLSLEFTKRCECILLSILSDSRFILYPPSVMAAATMLHVIRSVAPSLTDIYQDQLIGILKLHKEEVDECCNLVMELAPNGGLSNHSNKRKFGTLTVPASPSGVMDASFSLDSSNDSWQVSSAPPSVFSSPEPLSKKIKP